MGVGIRRRVVWLAGLCMWFACQALPGNLPDAVCFFRQMEMRVPFTSTEFKIDGRVTPQERVACAVTRQFITFETAARGDDRTAAYMAHNGSSFYVAFSIRLPKGETPRASASKRDSTALWKTDDAVELMITIDEQSFDFIGNSAGVGGDYRIEPKDMTWNHRGWRYAARRTKDGWEGEFLFPANVFGVRALGPETDCQLDIVNNAKSSYLSGLAYRGGAWHANTECYPRVHFARPGRLFQSESQMGVLPKGRIGIRAKIRNPSAQRKRLRVWAAFYRAKEGKETSYYRSVSGLFQTGGIALLPGATDEQLIRHVLTPLLKDYVQAGAIDETRSIAPGHTETIELWRHRFRGTYLMAELLRDADTGNVIYGGVFPFSIAPPLKTDLDYYYLTAKRIYAYVLLPSNPKIAALRHTVVDPKSGEKVSEKTAKVTAAGPRLKTGVSTPPLPAGHYRLDVAALDADGKVVSRNSVAFERPPRPKWFQCQAGKLIKVSYPWTPVKCGDGIVQVWGRRYEWGNGPFMRRIVSQSREVLAAPIRLRATVDGERRRPKSSRPVLKAHDQARAEYETVASLGPLHLTAKATVEFDGMCRFDITLSPRRRVTVNELSLEIPVRKEVAKFFSRYALGCMPRNEVPKGWDRYPRAGRVPSKALAFPFTPSIVLRNDDVGIEWFAEWDWGWSNRSKTERIGVVPRKDSTTLMISFIDKPVELEKPRTITFGFQVWPVKPWPAKQMNVSNYLLSIHKRKDGPKPFNTSLGATPQEFAENLKKAKALGLDVMWIFHWNAYRSPDGSVRHPPEYPVLLNAEVEERVKTYAKITQSLGVPVIGHVGYALPPTAPVFKYYGKEMAVHPIINKGIWGYKFTAYSPFPDAWVYGFKKLAETYHWSGVQLDGAFSSLYNECEETGCGVRDERGKLHGRYPIFAYRDFARRLYNVYHGEVKFPGIRHGFVYCHLGGHAMGAIHGFCDAIHSGEDRSTMLVKHLSEIDLDRERAIYASGAFGVPRDLLSKMPKAPIGPIGRMAWAIQLDMSMAHNRILNWTRREDYRKGAYPAHRLWLARRWVGARPENFVWYDESSHYLIMNQDHVVASFHLQRGSRMLLGVSNWKEEARTVQVRLKLDRLGFSRKPLVGEDAITGQPVPIRSGTLSLQVNGDAFRLIKVYTEE